MRESLNEVEKGFSGLNESGKVHPPMNKKIKKNLAKEKTDFLTLIRTLSQVTLLRDMTHRG